MKNRYIILSLVVAFSMFFIMCAGGSQQVPQLIGSDVCPNAKNPIECLVINNNRIPAFYTEFDMRYTGGGEDQNLFGKAYVDSKSGKYAIELSTMDIMVFKGTVIGDDIKILYRTDTDSFEGIVGKLSKLRMNRYTTLDFDIETILKILSLKVPILENYKMEEVTSRDGKEQYTLVDGNITDIITFYDEVPKVEYLIRAITEIPVGGSEKQVVSAFSYKYFDRAYKKETFNGNPFYFSQKVSLRYYFLDENNKKEERNIVLGLRNNIKFTNGFNDNTYEFDFPEGIKIHYEN